MVDELDCLDLDVVLAGSQAVCVYGQGSLEKTLATLACELVSEDGCYVLLLAMDAYRQERFCQLREKLANDFGEPLLNNLRVTTCHKFDQLLSDFESKGRLQNFIGILKRCKRILIPISSLDVGSAALAYWEWIQFLLGCAVPSPCYVCQNNRLEGRLRNWMDKNGVKRLHVCAEDSIKLKNSKDKSRLECQLENCSHSNCDDKTIPPQLILASLEKMREYASNACVCCDNFDTLRVFSEGIHRCGGVAHAFFVNGDERGKVMKNDTCVVFEAETDLIRPRSWEKALYLQPVSSGAYEQFQGAVTSDKNGLLVYNDKTLISGLGVLADSSDDFDVLAPGRFWRTVIGAYIVYSRVCGCFSLPNSSSELRFKPYLQLIYRILDYWKNAGLVSELYNGALALNDGARRVLDGAEISKLGALWMNSHRMICVTPTNERKCAIASLLASWGQRGCFQFGDSLYETVFNAFNENGTLIVRPAERYRVGVWIDQTGAIVSRKGMVAVWEMIRNRAIDLTLTIPNEEAQAVFADVVNAFADVTQYAAGFVEMTSRAMRWWTWGGAVLNHIVAACIELDSDVERVYFSNASITCIWKNEVDTDVPEEAAAKLVQRLRERMTDRTDAFMNDLVLHWIWPGDSARWLPLLGGRWQREYLASVLEKASKELDLTTDVPVIRVAQLHNLVEVDDALLLEKHKDSVANETVVEDQTVMQDKCALVEPAKNHSVNGSAYYKLEHGDGSQLMHTRLPWTMVRDERALRHAIDVMLNEPVIGLDTETTLFDQRLCLVQVGCCRESFLIDPLCVDVHALEQVFANPKIVKVIHNKSFECRVLGKLGIPIYNIIDTWAVSKKIYGKLVKGHKLKDVCLRELGYSMDKENQTSDWSKRPLSNTQLEYAALDAEIMIHLYCHFFGEPDVNPVKNGI